MAYIIGATNRKVNSIGSVMPVMIAVRAADNSRPPTSFFFSGFAVTYIASAAPGRPKIMNGNLPAMYRVASALNFRTVGSASWAKNIF